MASTDHTPIIGREKELAQLIKIFTEAGQGTGGMVLLSGEAGVGKTRLAEEGLSQSNFKFIIGRATEEGTPAYGPISSALRECLRQKEGNLIEPGPLSEHLRLVLPEFGSPPPPPDREMLTEALVKALSATAQPEPLAVFLDDLQWADDATLEILPDLADRLRDESILIIATYRSDEIIRGHRLRWMRNELRRRRQLTEISLESLQPEDAGRLIRHVLGAPPSQKLIDLIFEKTQGLPLFLEELTIALLDSGSVRRHKTEVDLTAGEDIPIPDSIRDATLYRLNGLSDAARNLLEVASVVGMELDLNFIIELAGSEAGLDELFERNLLRETTAGRAEFRHALTREAVRSEIVWSRRRVLNRKIAQHLETGGASPEIIAEHWLAANEIAKARLALIDSAEHSCHVHAYSDAARAANRALEIWQEGDDEENRLKALGRLAHCAQVSGQLKHAVKALREMSQSPMIKQNKIRFGETQRSLATVYGLMGTWEQSLEARTDAATAFEEANHYSDAAIEWLAAASRNTGMHELSTAIELCDRVYILGEKAGRHDLQARSLALKGNVLSIIGKTKEGIEIVHEALSLALKHQLPEAASEAYRRLGSTLEYASEYQSSREAYNTAYNYCRSHGSDINAQLCLGCMTWVLFCTGEWKHCLEICQEVITDPQTTGGSKSIALGVKGIIAAHRGESRQGRKHLHQALEFAIRNAVAAMEFGCYWGLALVEQHEGNNQSAANYYRQIIELRDQHNDMHDSVQALCSAVTFFGENRYDKDTALCADSLAGIASSTGNTEALGALAHALGETAMLNGNLKEATEQFLLALTHFEKLEMPLVQAKTEYRTGVALSRADTKEEAIPHLTGAYRLARNLGARPLAAQISEVLDSLGAIAEERRTPEASERVNRGGLTQRQLEIVQHIASGLTNKEIANKLFLSPRTVEMHVANVLNRLDCRSRSEAVKKAGELGLL